MLLAMLLLGVEFSVLKPVNFLGDEIADLNSEKDNVFWSLFSLIGEEAVLKAVNLLIFFKGIGYLSWKTLLSFVNFEVNFLSGEL